MNGWEIALTVFVAVAFLAAVGFLIFKKLTGKGGSCDCDCGGSCSGCPHACKEKKKDNKSV